MRDHKHVVAVMGAMRDGYEAMGIEWGTEMAFRMHDAIERCTDEQLADMAGFVRFINTSPQSHLTAGKKADAHIAANIGHDLSGIAAKAECFLPRTHGYARFLNQSAPA